MKRLYICACCCLIIFSGCLQKKKAEGNVTAVTVQLPNLGIAVQIPENYLQMSREQMDETEMPATTVLDVEPFIVSPQYAFREKTGKGLIIVSSLGFIEGATPGKYPMDNIFIYKKNLEAYFAAGEITHEEIPGEDITTILLAVLLQEGDLDIYLFKGLSYCRPDMFFMIDLYYSAAITDEDAIAFQNVFNSYRDQFVKAVGKSQ